MSEATRRRVREVADQLGYRPDPRVATLRRDAPGLVALTVSVPTGVRTPVAEFAHNAAVIEAPPALPPGANSPW